MTGISGKRYLEQKHHCACPAPVHPVIRTKWIRPSDIDNILVRHNERSDIGPERVTICAEVASVEVGNHWYLRAGTPIFPLAPPAPIEWMNPVKCWHPFYNLQAAQKPVNSCINSGKRISVSSFLCRYSTSARNSNCDVEGRVYDTFLNLSEWGRPITWSLQICWYPLHWMQGQNNL